MRIVVNPPVLSFLFNLLDTSIRFNSNQQTASFDGGFNRALNPTYDGIPIIVDHRATSTLGNPLYIIDVSPTGWYMVVSKAPQLTGLAKVSASTSAYIEGYITTIYANPRRIHLYDNNSS